MGRSINDQSVVAGRVGSSAFVYDAGTYSRIDIPGASRTLIRGINNSNTVVGAYSLGGNHGFIASATSFTRLDVPGGGVTNATAINNLGVVVGGYNGGANGYRYDSGTYTLVNVPGAISTLPTGINDAGDIVGYYTNSSNATLGFMYRGGAFTTIAVPGAAVTNVLGLNNAGDIVGDFVMTPGGYEMAFLLKNGIYSVLEVPGLAALGTATIANATAINNAGKIVGYSGLADNSFVTGFIATPVAGAPLDILLEGGTASAPTLLPTTGVNSVTGSIGGDAGTSAFYTFDWAGGAFRSDLSVDGVLPTSGTYYDFQLCAGGDCSTTLIQTMLDKTNGWTGFLSSASLAAGAYTIGLLEHSGGPDPLFRLSFSSPVSAAVPEPSSWATMLAGFGLVGMVMRRRKTVTA